MGRYKVDPITGELTLMNPSMSDIPIYQGVSGSTASVSGLVPQAQAGDEDKALLGNGTWGSVSGGETISYADWLQLTPEEQTHGEYFIPDFNGSIIPTGGIDELPTENSRNLVYSGGVYAVTKPFEGAQESEAGSGGTVPAPSAGDQDKVLKGDGTWGEAAADDNFVGSLEEWNSLTPQQREKYNTVDINDDFNGIPIDTELSTESTNPVQNKAVANPIEAMVNLYGSKNLLPTEASSQVLEGITYTVNSDGTIDVNGSTSSNWSVLHTTTFLLPKGTYKFWNDGDTNCYLFGRANNASGAIVFDGSTSSDTFTLSSDTIIYAGIAVRNYVIVHNRTVYPMIRDARIADDTYVPYAMTNLELTNQVTSLSNLTLKYSTHVKTSKPTAGQQYVLVKQVAEPGIYIVQATLQIPGFTAAGSYGVNIDAFQASNIGDVGTSTAYDFNSMLMKTYISTPGTYVYITETAIVNVTSTYNTIAILGESNVAIGNAQTETYLAAYRIAY